jgi:hypothetical protein
VVECPPRIFEALSSNPRTTHKKKKKTERKEREREEGRERGMGGREEQEGGRKKGRVMKLQKKNCHRIEY